MGPCAHGYYGTCCVYAVDKPENAVETDPIQVVKNVLKNRKPPNDSHVESLFWRETVRDIADSLFDRPDWSMKLTDSMEEWIRFTDEVGYLS